MLAALNPKSKALTKMARRHSRSSSGGSPDGTEKESRRDDETVPSGSQEKGTGTGTIREGANAPSSAAPGGGVGRRPGKAEPTHGELEGFERWWAAYPLKKARKPALAAFVKVLREKAVDLETLMRGAQAYAGERAGKDPGKTAHGATWLNNERWKDEVPPLALAPPGPGRRAPMQGFSAVDHAISMIASGEH